MTGDGIGERTLRFDAAGVTLDGDLWVPDRARGVVTFAHGGGSSRLSPRNRHVAAGLRATGFATLLVDLLTEEETRIDLHTREFRFDIPRLSARLTAVVDWLGTHVGLPDALFGASTGAAAALTTAADRPERVRVVISRSGRPDLAGAALRRVGAPTLLIVGGHDRLVLELNRRAARCIPGPAEVAVVPGATHLFEEAGALDDVIDLATTFLTRWIDGEPPDRA